MIMNKIAINKDNYKNCEYFYDSAREAMFDLLNTMYKKKKIDVVLLPGYIGWSPKEGSGIFDPIIKLKGLSVEYYKITYDLSIDIEDIKKRILKLKTKKFAVLIVNYFGFIDLNINDIVDVIRENGGWIIEDNAHGFFSYYYNKNKYSDATFFSLHKLFPFDGGGSLIIRNKMLKELNYSGLDIKNTRYNPYEYNLHDISYRRVENYLKLEELINSINASEHFIPLKKLDKNIVPQSYPIRIIKGNRDKIYELMNNDGYGVVSLYHTLIDELNSTEYKASIDLSKCIMNLPVHQDVDSGCYKSMVEMLLKYCKLTADTRG